METCTTFYKQTLKKTAVTRCKQRLIGEVQKGPNFLTDKRSLKLVETGVTKGL